MCSSVAHGGAALIITHVFVSVLLSQDKSASGRPSAEFSENAKFSWLKPGQIVGF